MLASAIQLAAGVIFAFTIFMRKTRKDKDLHELSQVRLNVSAQINPNLHQLLYETYMFRIGTAVLCIGYLVPIAELDHDGFNSPFVNVSVAIVIAGAIVVTTHFFSMWQKKRRINKLAGFDPHA